MADPAFPAAPATDIPTTGSPIVDGLLAAVVGEVLAAVSNAPGIGASAVLDAVSPMFGDMVAAVDSVIDGAVDAVSPVVDEVLGAVGPAIGDYLDVVRPVLAALFAELAMLLDEAVLPASPEPKVPSATATGAPAAAASAAEVASDTSSAASPASVAHRPRLERSPHSNASRGRSSPEPAGPRPSSPEPLALPGASSLSSNTLLSGGAFAVLVALLGLSACCCARLIEVPPALWRPVGFVAVIERPD